MHGEKKERVVGLVRIIRKYFTVTSELRLIFGIHRADLQLLSPGFGNQRSEFAVISDFPRYPIAR